MHCIFLSMQTIYNVYFYLIDNIYAMHGMRIAYLKIRIPVGNVR